MTATALSLPGLPMAWVRIYLGVHFALEMPVAAFVAGLTAWLAFRGRSLCWMPLYSLVIAIHDALFGALIRLGWVDK